MTEIVEDLQPDGSRIVRLRFEQLEVDVAPQVGGRIVRIRHLGSGHEFLWRNSRLCLEPKPPGSEYDPNFYGGIDGHYTVVLEPCTTMPLRVGDAIRNGRCSRLLPGEALETDVSLYAGPDE